MPQPSFTWLALGDSYTIGEGVDPADRWPAQLARINSIELPQYVAETGWTTVDLLAAIKQTELQDQYDRITVLIGVNDQYDGLGIDAYQRGLAEIVHLATRRVALPQRVLVVSIPDYSVTPKVRTMDTAHIAQEIKRFNAVARQVATTASASYCDVTELSQRAAHDSTLLAEDQLHPSGKMYDLWAKEIARVILSTP
ncbi:MAG: GDSL-type esterase/lipase family protein [Tunicatimonas sp.]